MSTAPRIIIVEDNPPMTQTLVDILSAKGYAVHAAYSGLQKYNHEHAFQKRTKRERISCPPALQR